VSIFEYFDLENKKDNPFYHNYVFTKADLERVKINHKPWYFWFLPTLIMRNDGYAWFYKTCNGCVWLIKCEELCGVRIDGTMS
jgi:hypothetical protein